MIQALWRQNKNNTFTMTERFKAFQVLVKVKTPMCALDHQIEKKKIKDSGGVKDQGSSPLWVLCFSLCPFFIALFGVNTSLYLLCFVCS